MHIVFFLSELFGELNNGANWINFSTPDTQHTFDERRS